MTSSIDILAVAAHRDDVELTCGGTLVKVRGDYEVPNNFFAKIADRLVVERTIGRDIDRANASYRALCEQVSGERT